LTSAWCRRAVRVRYSRGVELEDRIQGLVAAGHVEAAAILVVDHFGGAMQGYLRPLHEEDDAVDVFARWVEDVWRGVPGFRGECSLHAWCYRLARRASVRFRRRGPWRKRKDRLRTRAASELAATLAVLAASRRN
jgi:RNA polymerase sigma-70 factor, ECF subfamily